MLARDQKLGPPSGGLTQQSPNPLPVQVMPGPQMPLLEITVAVPEEVDAEEVVEVMDVPLGAEVVIALPPLTQYLKVINKRYKAHTLNLLTHFQGSSLSNCRQC
jgi:hypothetical protein